MKSQMHTDENSHFTTKSSEARRARRFALALTAALIAVIGAIGLVAGVNIFQAGWIAGFALTAGIVVTIALGVSLMALVFYSNRSGADDAVTGMGEDDPAR